MNERGVFLPLGVFLVFDLFGLFGLFGPLGGVFRQAKIYYLERNRNGRNECLTNILG